MKRLDALAISAFILITSGSVVQGLMTHRWIPNTAVVEAVHRLDAVPKNFGDWTSVDLKLSDAELTIGGIAGYIKREFTNQQTGAQVTLLLVAGAPGPISLHSPTVCFSGQGFQVHGHESGFAVNVTEANVSDHRHVFHYADFSNSAVSDPSLIRVYWAWSPDGRWQSPEQPRIAFAGSSALYKLYVSERWLPEVSGSDTGTGKLFLETALPEITQALSQSLSTEEN